MLELYTSLNPLHLLAWMMVAVLAVVFQARRTVWQQGGLLQKTFEVMLLAHIILLSLLLRIIKGELVLCSVVSGNYAPLRWGLGIAIIVAGLVLWLKEKRMSIFSGVMLTIMGLPILEKLPYGGFTLCLLASLTLLIVRAYLLSRSDMRKRTFEITEDSVKEAIDAQHSGLLFSGKEGEILLENRQMIFLIKQIAGFPTRNAQAFWGSLTQNGSGNAHLVHTDGRAWQFSRSPILWKRKIIYQTIATEVTKTEEITQRLREKQESLLTQRETLIQAMTRREELRAQDAAQQMWTHIHNLLGQRVSVLHRTLSAEETPTAQVIEPLLRELLDNLTLPHEDSCELLYDELVSSLAILEVTLSRKGTFPKNETTAKFFMECIREGVANALRHGKAKSIAVELNETSLVMTNDGIPSSETISWGGGISEMNRRSLELSGVFTVETRPVFQIKIELPTGKEIK